MVWVSMPLSLSTTTMPSESNGYGPRISSSQSTASGVVPVPPGSASPSASVQIWIGTPLSDSRSVCWKSPNATVTRYDDAGSARCQVLVDVPPFSVLFVSWPLATPDIGAGAVRVKS